MESIKGFLAEKTVYKSAVKYTLTGASDLRRAAPKRGRFSHKYKNGMVVVVGGSYGYHGAPALSSTAAHNTLAALRVGAGFVKAYVPSSILQSERSVSPNVIIEPSGKRSIAVTGSMKKDLERADAVAMGMGLGRDRASLMSARSIIELCTRKGTKLIVDADGLKALRLSASGTKRDILITPHDGEFRSVFGIRPPHDLKGRVMLVVRAAKKSGVTILLKGHNTVVSDGVRAKVNRAKSAALATMGTGDVLDGIIAGYAATGASLFDAACAGAHLHSIIGDFLHAKKGDHIIATDIIDALPDILKKFDKR